MVRTTPIALSLLLIVAAPRARADGVIARENEKPGDGDFQIDAGNVGAMKSIDVYPSRWSVAPGGVIGLRVSTTAATFRTRVYRLGWYGGAGARLVTEVASTKGATQPVPTPDPIFGLAECRWKDSLTLPITAEMTPGVYFVRVTGSDGPEASTYFVVRDDGVTPRAKLLLVIPTATEEAYNAWPRGGTIAPSGKSLYGWNSSDELVEESADTWAVKVSFDRPYAAGAGTGDLLTRAYPFFRWVEKKGYDVAYAVSADVDDGPVVSGRAAIAVAGHDEYWSHAMFDHLEAARDGGVDLAFFTGDTGGWQVRFEASASGDARGVMTGYKEHAYVDAASGGWPGDPYLSAGREAADRGDLTTARWFFSRVTGAFAALKKDDATGIDARRPGMRLTGVAYGGATTGAGFDFIVKNASHWIYAGTGLHDGDALAKLVGYEWDNPRQGDATWDDVRPKGQLVLSSSSTESSPVHGASYYEASSGAGVLSVGTIQWSWALADRGVGETPHDARVETITQNVLDHFLATGVTTFDAGPGSDDAGVVIPVDARSDVDDAIAEPGDDGVTEPDAAHRDASANDAFEAGNPGSEASSSPTPSSSSSSCGCRDAGAPPDDARPMVIAVAAMAMALASRRARGA